MKYAAKKGLMLLLTMLIVSFLVIVAFQILPGDPTTKLLGTQATPERIAALRAELGLDDPWLLRYWNWLKAFVTGDMGTSYSYGMPVSRLVGEKLPVTLRLSGLAFLFILVFSMPLGILFASRAARKVDGVITTFNQVIMSVPPFFMGIIISYLFGTLLKWFIPGNYVSLGEDPMGHMVYLLFPAFAIAIPRIAMTVRLLRSTIAAQMKENYVRTAYSRGGSPAGILWGHVLKNSLLPVVTFLAMTFADIVANSIVVEQVFGIPGLGRLLLAGISNQDQPTAQAIIVIISFVVMVMNYAADLINQRIDPRLRLQ